MQDKYTWEQIKGYLMKCISEGYEEELRLYIRGKEYMIIIYEDHCSFQRCGVHDGSGEYNYKDLDELYRAVQPDGIVLEHDWDGIECIEDEFGGLSD